MKWKKWKNSDVINWFLKMSIKIDKTLFGLIKGREKNENYKLPV